MNYLVRDANINDYDLIKSYKRHSIFDYADNLTQDDIDKINKYIENNVKIEGYKIITNKEDIVGAYLITNENGYLLDEIFIEEKYRNKGIGTSILKTIIKNYPNINLWVYKNNVNAYSLYKKIGFKVIDETETRYFMSYIK